MELSPKHQRFVSEFLVDLNGSKAARRAGFSERSARQIANQLLSKHDIKAAIQARCQETEQRLQISRDDVIKGFLAAFQMAREQGNPSAMVSAVREIGRMLGHYNTKQRQESLPTGDVERLKQHLATLSDRELLEMVEKG